ncbi:hypothetical protein QUB05_15505, partial [Microcoleus sp. F10-C6]|uniref:hypothetical protein n=1 Tax=unclassified Microcoleus TaxID=2642155 RepID=UPI002FD3DDB7
MGRPKETQLNSTVKFMRIFVSKSLSSPSSFFPLPSRFHSLGVAESGYETRKNARLEPKMISGILMG